MFICLDYFFFFADPKNYPIRDSDPRNDPNREFFDPLQPYRYVRKILLEVRVKDLADWGLCQTFPVYPHYTFGLIRSVQKSPP